MFKSEDILPPYRLETFHFSTLSAHEEKHRQQVEALVKKITPRLHPVREAGKSALSVEDVTEALRIIKVCSNDVNHFDVVGIACFKFEVTGKGERVMCYYGQAIQPSGWMDDGETDTYDDFGFGFYLNRKALEYLASCTEARKVNLSIPEEA